MCSNNYVSLLPKDQALNELGGFLILRDQAQSRGHGFRDGDALVIGAQKFFQVVRVSFLRLFANSMDARV